MCNVWGQRALVGWYDTFNNRPPLVLVHGEPDAQNALRDLIEKELAAPVHIAADGDRFDLLQPVPF